MNYFLKIIEIQIFTNNPKSVINSPYCNKASKWWKIGLSSLVNEHKRASFNRYLSELRRGLAKTKNTEVIAAKLL